jgi:Tfp pilus assembly protein PilN
VVALDKLAEAIRMTDQPEKRQYVWLNRLDQNNVTFSMTGVSSSVLGVADFIANLQGTGYFKGITQFSARDDSGNFNFTLTCEFSPPGRGAAVKTGAN